MLKISDPLFKKKIPKNPGVYIFYNKEKKPLYVGKAAVLKKRVLSYFSSKKHKIKTRVLISSSFFIDFFITKNEHDSFLLENNFIKTFSPKYNVLLKDDKSFPWICLKKEAFPRVFVTRVVNKEDGEFFGPFLSSKKANSVLKIIKKLYPIRSCSFLLNEKNISSSRFSVCLDYHINKCLGPCEGFQTEGDYNKNIDHIRFFLRGNFSPILGVLKQKMVTFSKNLEFERAQKIKEKIILLEDYKKKSIIVNNSFSNHDVFCFLSGDKVFFLSFIRVSSGVVSVYKNSYVKKVFNENNSYLLSLFVKNIYSDFSFSPNSIISNIKIDNYKSIVPKKGYKKNIIDFSLHNLLLYKQRFELKKSKKKDFNFILNDLKQKLKLNNKPNYIECFDNSNLFGKNPTSACVVFKKGIPLKKEYIHYNIKTVENINDFDSMYEVVTRRYSFLKKENKIYPDLILIDGGKGQLSSSYKALKNLDLNKKIDLISIAKKEEIIYSIKNKSGYIFNKYSDSLKLLQQLRNEAHFFSLNFHRKKRLKSFIKSELDNIPGIGFKSKKIILGKFKNINNIKKQTLKNFIKVLGKKRGVILFNYFNK